MAEYIEGKRPVLEALKVGVPVKRLYVAEGLKGDKAVDEVVRRAHKMKISVKQIKRHEMDERSERGSHQGLMLETGSYQYSNVNEIVIAANKRAEANDGKALIVVLDHITDAGNLGAIARSAGRIRHHYSQQAFGSCNCGNVQKLCWCGFSYQNRPG